MVIYDRVATWFKTMSFEFDPTSLLNHETSRLLSSFNEIIIHIIILGLIHPFINSELPTPYSILFITQQITVILNHVLFLLFFFNKKNKE